MIEPRGCASPRFFKILILFSISVFVTYFLTHVVPKCFGIWDQDGRADHKGLWRLHLKTNPVFVVGVPYSPYSSVVKLFPTCIKELILICILRFILLRAQEIQTARAGAIIDE